ncbi:Signal transduction histidine kinase internal region domain-containing protein [Tenacibaculum sp. 190524A05c]
MSIQKLYSKIVLIGTENSNRREEKRIRLLNVFCVTWIFCLIMFMITDQFFEKSLNKSIGVHLFSFISLFLVLFFQFKRWFILARVLFIIALIISIFSFSVYLEIGRFMENFYFLCPLIALIFIEKKWIVVSFMIICWALYFVPSKLYNIYPEHPMNPALIFAVFLGSFVILNYSQVLNRKNEEKLEEAYLELEEKRKNEFAHLQLKSLKAQMNPHFMFNAMNSIQNLVLKGDKHEAYNYLTKFSSLIRDNLNMSEKSFVSFEDEILLLKKYLELEKLRFRENFQYEMIGIDFIDSIKVPSMIIQPFVENAIKHGLLHKKTGIKKVTLKFTLHEVLECTIIDNGIGMRASKDINELNDLKNNSLSTKLIEERLTLLKDYYKTNIGFSYIDIPEGTKVIIKIPYTA